MLQSSSSAAASDGITKKHMWGIVLVASLILLLLISFFLCRRKLFSFTIIKGCTRTGCLKEEKLMLRKFELKEVEKATKGFSSECLLGSGAFGNVYKGTFQDGATFAIKRPLANSYQSVEEFRNEVRLLSRVRHRNLVGLVGFCEESGAKGAKILVYEYVPNGSLLDYITGRKSRNLNWRQRVTVAIEAAKGIAHLHEEGIIHRDLKPSNILMGEGLEAKVADFRLVKTGPVGDQSHVTSQVKGTPGYLDPAYWSSHHLTPFTDVYSFGVILLQLVSARPALDSNPINQSTFHIVDWARPSIKTGNVGEILDANLISEPCNLEMMIKMAELGLKCVTERPKLRPTITEVWQQLELALTSPLSVINKRTAGSFRRPSGVSESGLDLFDHSQSSISIDGVQLQRFRVEMEDDSVQSSGSLRRFEVQSVSFDVDEMGRTMQVR